MEYLLSKEIKPLFNTTELGAIAYRLDAIASQICHIADDQDDDELNALARKLWGAMDDLVAYGMAQQ